MFTITPAAAEQIRNAAVPDTEEELLLRVAAKLDEQGDVVYGMGFDAERERDLRVETAGVTVLIGEPSAQLLDDTVLDFVEFEPGDWRFIFMGRAQVPSPAAGGCGSGNCGCGRA